METAFLLAIVCASGVQTGWQPADDVPGAYQYSVAVDPQTARALTADGQRAIEVAIPQDLRHISSIRLTVGDEPLARRQRVTTLKSPLPAGAVETQMYEGAAGGSPRYGAPAGGTFDPYAQPQPSAEALFSGTPGAAPRYPGAPGSYPNTTPTAAAPTAASDYARNVANQYGQAAGQTAAQWQAEAQRQYEAGVQAAATPVRDALSNAGDQFRTAIGNLGDRSREALQGVTQPLTGHGLFRPESPAAGTMQNPGPPWAPALVQSNPNMATTSGNWGAATPTAAGTRPTPANPWDNPGGFNGAAASNAPTPAGNWAASPAGAPYAGAAGGAAQPTPAGTTDQRGGAPTYAAQPSGAANPYGQPPASNPYGQPAGSNPYGQNPTAAAPRERIDYPIDPQDAGRWTGAQPSGPLVQIGGDRYGNSAASSGQQPAGAASPTGAQAGAGGLASQWPGNQGAGATTSAQPPWYGDGSPRTAAQPTGAAGGGTSFDGGPSFPRSSFPDYTQNGAGGAGQQPPAGQGGSNPPSITGDMLAGDASAPLDGDPSALWPASHSNPTGADAGQGDAAAGHGDAATNAANPNAPGNDRPTAADFGWDNPDAQTAGGAQPPASDRNVIPVIVAWTLLFSSVAGNAYLLWSYLEVRMKYRTLVRRGGQGVRTRFGAA
ncbi:MAG: hypothetical protein CMJ58_17255 [Planctomycetaceae bacterium]|nr:hypothetical protein [Planctomycetaceae bacterium]